MCTRVDVGEWDFRWRRMLFEEKDHRSLRFDAIVVFSVKSAYLVLSSASNRRSVIPDRSGTSTTRESVNYVGQTAEVDLQLPSLSNFPGG
ncbi:hypothetical protein A2U01_0041023 [Trifolium medium]|uniref:Uncharacterized protein n=1 Tax=Trifolium medium TaxID=97028 RepID=A0A392Q642_9FABA|nr:hypothetical protein [Trifolium medium]